LILRKNRQYLNYLVHYKSEPPSWKFLQMSLQSHAAECMKFLAMFNVTFL
jgi:hypothetical protein